MDRLSRNPVDSGQVQWLLQRRKIHSILVAGREYRSEDNIIALCVESGADTQYIVDLRRNVIRGMKSKVEKGWLPSVAPLGYLNYRDIEEVATIIKDPERFQMVRGIWDLALAGTQTQKILDIANNQWGLRTRKTRKKMGKQLSKSRLYEILSNVFYTGRFEYKGSLYEGRHEAMITVAEFEASPRVIR